MKKQQKTKKVSAKKPAHKPATESLKASKPDWRCEEELSPGIDPELEEVLVLEEHLPAHVQMAVY